MKKSHLMLGAMLSASACTPPEFKDCDPEQTAYLQAGIDWIGDYSEQIDVEMDRISDEKATFASDLSAALEDEPNIQCADSDEYMGEEAREDVAYANIKKPKVVFYVNHPTFEEGLSLWSGYDEGTYEYLDAMFTIIGSELHHAGHSVLGAHPSEYKKAMRDDEEAVDEITLWERAVEEAARSERYNLESQ